MALTLKKKHMVEMCNRARYNSFLKGHIAPLTMSALIINIGKDHLQLIDLYNFIRNTPDWRMKLLTTRCGGLKGLANLEKFAVREGLISESNHSEVELKELSPETVFMLRAFAKSRSICVDDLKRISKLKWEEICWKTCFNIKVIEEIERIMFKYGVIREINQYMHGRFSAHVIRFMQLYSSKKFPTLSDIHKLLENKDWKRVVLSMPNGTESVLRELNAYRKAWK